jgi:hypothetical protein
LQLPSVVKYSPDNKQLRNFFNYIDRICLLGFTMLNCSDDWDRVTGMFELTKIVQTNAMFMSGFRPRDYETVGYLLDKGLRIAFFDVFDDRVARDMTNALSRLPRTRIGVHFKSQEVTAQFLIESIDSYYRHCSHFIFRIDNDLSNPEADHILEEAKTIAGLRHVQVYFIAHYSCPEDAATIATTHESIHSIIYPQYLQDDAEGNLVADIMPYASDTRACVDYMDAFICCLQSDRDDKLIATVGKHIKLHCYLRFLFYLFLVCDETGHSLGLVYSNEEVLFAVIVIPKFYVIYYLRV